MSYRNTSTPGHRLGRRFLGLAALVCAVTSPATAQWTVINLHPSGATGSRAMEVRDGKQVGHAIVGGVDQAAMWSGSAHSWINLHPGWTGASSSRGTGVEGSQQTGYADAHAGLWSGGSGTWTDLLPAGALWSFALATHAGMQVGYASFDGTTPRAGMWFSTASSWTDLHPDWAGATESHARGVDGAQQVGQATVGGVIRASLWYGTPQSWVDLTPPGAEFAYIDGVHNGQQVGTAKVGGILRASLWQGTSISWTDLNPAGATRSQAYGVHNGQQVGYVSVSGDSRASFWSGTPGSWVDLHRFLHKRFRWSLAMGISHDANYTYVVGWGYDPSAGRDEAMMWRRRN